MDFTQQRLVQLELLAIHLLLSLLALLLVHLLLQEGCILVVDRLDLGRQTLLLILVVLLVASPQHSLLVIVGLRGCLALLLFAHLAVEQMPHFLLLLLFTGNAALFLGSKSQFALHFVLGQRVVLVTLLLCLGLDHVAGHVVHELLGAALAGNELALAVLLLLIEHTNVLLLGLHVHGALAGLVLFSLLFVHFIFNKHLLKVVALLLALLSLQLTLGLHLFLQTVDQVHFSAEGILLVDSALALLFHELAVAGLLLLLGFDAGEVALFLFAHAE